MTLQMGELVRIKSGLRKNQIGRVINNQGSIGRNLYQVEFPNDPTQVFFFDEELERVVTMPCPKCVFEGRETQLSEPYHTKEGWVQDCQNHGRLYLWGWYRVEEGGVLDLLTGKNLKI